jgi:hypothetical protein
VFRLHISQIMHSSSMQSMKWHLSTLMRTDVTSLLVKNKVLGM